MKSAAAITVRDDVGEMPTEFDTLDDAIAEAMRQLDGDGIVAVHDAECAHDGKSDDTCTCEPLELVLGAQA